MQITDVRIRKVEKEGKSLSELKKYIRQLTRNELVAFLKVKITLVRIEK